MKLIDQIRKVKNENINELADTTYNDMESMVIRSARDVFTSLRYKFNSPISDPVLSIIMERFKSEGLRVNKVVDGDESVISLIV